MVLLDVKSSILREASACSQGPQSSLVLPCKISHGGPDHTQPFTGNIKYHDKRITPNNDDDDDDDNNNNNNNNNNNIE